MPRSIKTSWRVRLSNLIEMRHHLRHQEASSTLACFAALKPRIRGFGRLHSGKATPKQLRNLRQRHQNSLALVEGLGEGLEECTFATEVLRHASVLL